MAISRIFDGIWPFSQMVRIDGLESFIKKTNAEPWHSYAIRKRYKRRHVCIACGWLAKTIPKNAIVFEAACGSGINLLWFWQRGFKYLKGADLSPEAVCLSRMLSNNLKIPIDVWQDNSLHPQIMPANISGMLSVNWLYHLPGASLEDFLLTYRPFLAPNGKIAFDMIDYSYNLRKNNEYHTDDLELSINARRASEYKLRLSAAEIKHLVENHGYVVLRFCQIHGSIPKTVWLIQRKS